MWHNSWLKDTRPRQTNQHFFVWVRVNLVWIFQNSFRVGILSFYLYTQHFKSDYHHVELCVSLSLSRSLIPHYACNTQHSPLIHCSERPFSLLNHFLKERRMEGKREKGKTEEPIQVQLSLCAGHELLHPHSHLVFYLHFLSPGQNSTVKLEELFSTQFWGHKALPYWLHQCMLPCLLLQPCGYVRMENTIKHTIDQHPTL